MPIELIGQEGIRCATPFRRRGKAGAAPATVGGESFSHMPLGLAMQGLGRRRRVKTREPGDLPERSHPSGVRGARAGRISAAVTTWIVTRMEAATTMLARILRPNIAKTVIVSTLAAAIVVAFAGSAAADDAMVTKALAIPFAGPAYNWNGFYAGGQMGYAWGSSNFTASSPGTPNVSGSFSMAQPSTALPRREASSPESKPVTITCYRTASSSAPRSMQPSRPFQDLPASRSAARRT